ncbi:galactitol-1-phosphate 5-dehydrogenase [Superficieibacter sp. 1612_C1]|uniref:galactitol-1-phosphate 5-dehydrogenase n=1 Tax=Superficieibacter sp. 1612_C1 TaxID=2780382 RepID=UPI00188410D4|nr:galactitol-1-phosphate 5-dehydrogenase [Superficieibacter sp. 1612_C1]
MKALNLYSVQDVRYEETPRPVITADDDVIISVQVAGICGSDISRFGKLGSYQPGLTWGHEFSGVVAETGAAVKGLNKGDRVTACNCFPCFECQYCQQGRYAHCVDLKVLGGHKNGAFADYIRLPARNVLKLPDTMDFATASFIEPSSVVVHGLRQVDIKAGCRMAIVGCGTIGLLAVQWAKICGAGEVFAFDVDPQKLSIAKATGADRTFCVRDDDHLSQFNALTAGCGVDIVIESSGNAAGIASSLLLAAKGGSIVLLGIPYGDVAFPRLNFEKIVRNELKVCGSWNSISAPFPGQEWKTSIDYLSAGKINIKPLITRYVSLEEAPALFPALYKRETFFVKVLIDIGGQE